MSTPQNVCLSAFWAAALDAAIRLLMNRFRVRLKPDTTTIALVLEKCWRRREISFRTIDGAVQSTFAALPLRWKTFA
jgi:hypothetical protein